MWVGFEVSKDGWTVRAFGLLPRNDLASHALLGGSRGCF